MRLVTVLLVLTGLVGCKAPEPNTHITPVVATTVKPRPLIVECDLVLPCFEVTKT